jgi:hypothetical protein
MQELEALKNSHRNDATSKEESIQKLNQAHLREKLTLQDAVH